MDWKSFFGDYATIVLVANSEDADLDRLGALYCDDAVFVFFNKAERVVSGKFDRDAVLVLRSGRKGPSVVLKSDLDRTVRLFAPGRLKSVVQLRTADFEALLDPARFHPHQYENLDLTPFFAGTYPAHKTASSGYAMALWILSLDVPAKIVLSGFTSLRSKKWVIFPAHAWTFEQLALRILTRRGRLAQDPAHPSAERTVAALRAQFPDFDEAELLLSAFEVLTERLESTNTFLDRLWAMTRVSRGLYSAFDLLRRPFRRRRT